MGTYDLSAFRIMYFSRRQSGLRKRTCPSHGASAVLNENQLYKNLVSIGHSLGGAASAVFYALQPKFKFRTMILIEHMFINGKCLSTTRDILVKMAYQRRDVWSSQKEALDRFKRVGWRPQVVDLFVGPSNIN